MQTIGYYAYSSEEEKQSKLEFFEQYDLDIVYGIEKAQGREHFFADFLEDTMPDRHHTIIIYGLDVLGSTMEEIYNSICVLNDMSYESQLVCEFCEHRNNKYFLDSLDDLSEQE